MHAVPLSVNFCAHFGHGCTSDYFFFCPAIGSLQCRLPKLRNQICGDAVPKRPTPLLHPQSLVVTLLWRLSDCFSVSSCTCGLPYRDTYNKQGKADRCRRGTQSQTRTNRTRCRAADFPATSSQQNEPDGTMYHPSAATNLITLLVGI